MKFNELLQENSLNMFRFVFIFSLLLFSQYAVSETLNKVTLSENNTTLKAAFEEIEKQTNLSVDYEESKIDISRKINISVTDMTVNEALNLILKNSGYTYAIKGKHIIISMQQPQQQPLPQQQVDNRISISGTVTDTNGEPIIGANVVERGTTNGTITDIDGKFTLEVSDNAVLTVSYVGYISREITVGNQRTLTILLSEDTQTLDEVVVVGYGSQKKANLTGAISQVDSKLLENRSVTNLGQALQGQIANLNITIGGGGGDPGTGTDFNVRGFTSLSGGAPFILIDGVPGGNLNAINPNDIESITVLKDAASSAIYGARAAYGVILVTTKTGDKNSQMKVSYGSVFSQNRAIRIPNQVNSLEFAEAYNIASVNASQSPMYTEEHIQRIIAYMKDPENTPSNVPNPSNPNYWSYATLDNDNVDWIRTFFKPSFSTQKHDLNVSGGTDKSGFYVGAGFYDQGGLLRYADEKYRRLNVTSNLHFEPYKWLSGDFRLSFYKDDKNTISNAYDGDIGNWMHLATTRFPNWSLKDPNGYWASTSHIYKLQDGGRSITQGNMYSLTGALQAKPIEGWKINFDYTYKRNDFQGKHHAKPVIWEYTVDKQPVMTTQFDGYNTDITTTNYNTMNVYTSYDKNINGHYFSALVGYQQEYSEVHSISGSKRNLISHEIPSIGVAVGDQNISEGLSHWANMGVFMRSN